ncbi:MAG: tRNA modification GTPase MnmE [Planctomycetota bacterium]
MAVRETIVAVASPPGRGVRALVRASGPGVRAAAKSLLGAVPTRRGVEKARARITTVDGDACACPVLAMWMEAGASFTGEDSLEISCVGAPALIELIAVALVDGARAAGFAARLARPGEFAFRAHLAGRISVDEAESMAARIAATSDADIIAADELASGTTGMRATELLARTAELLALVEAGIDFTDQDDVVAIAPAVLSTRANELAVACAQLRGEQASAHARAVALVVLAGAPNAGKSTLFNALLGRARSIASVLAGTTRDAIVERVCIGTGLEVDLADLAGLDAIGGEGLSATIHRDMQRHARAMLASADVVVRCTAPGMARVELVELAHDAMHDPTHDPTHAATNVVDVATMVDLVPSGAYANSGAHADSGAIAVSARTGQGIDLLRNEIAARIRRDGAMRRARLSTILPRHDAAFRAAHDALADAAARAASPNARGRYADIEIIASALRSALDALGEVSAPMHPDDVLGLVFSRFCIGK